MPLRRALNASILIAVIAVSAQIATLGLSGDARIAAASSASILAGLAAALAMLAAAARVSHPRVRWAWLSWSVAAGFWILAEIARSVAAATGSEAASAAALLSLILFGLLAVVGFAKRSPEGALAFRLFVIDAAPVVILTSAAASTVHPRAVGFASESLLIATAAVSSLVVVIALQLLLNWRTWSMVRVTAGFSLPAAAMLARVLQRDSELSVQPAWAGALSVAGLLGLVAAGVIRARASDRYTAYFALDRDNGLRWLPPVAGIAGIVLVRASPLGSRHSVLLYGSLVAATFFLVVRFVLVHRTAERMLAHLARSREALENSEERYRELFENANDIVFTTDLKGNFTSINRAGVEVTGYARDEIMQLNVADLAEGESLERARAELRRKLAGATEESVYELELHAKDGRRVPFELSTRLVRENGEPVAIQGIARDVSERRAYQQALEHQAFHDSLTDLANRALFWDRVEHALVRSRRASTGVAVLFADLDDFKTVNDSLGHDAGDELLIAVGERLRQCVRPADTCARLGGDEFAVLLEDVSDPGDATQAAERIMERFEAPFSLRDNEMFIHASVGIAFSSSCEAEASELLRSADIAMYRAKRRGGNQHVMFEPEMLAVVRDRHRLTSELRCGLDRREFTVHYQPIVLLETGAAVGVEALLRWRHPRRGLLLPAEFITLAEETGLILPLGQFVLGEACRQARVWQTTCAGASDLTVSVNVSGRQLREPSVVADVARALEASGLAPSSLILEVTETVWIDDMEGGRQLRRLKELGVQLAIDDFGASYSSLTQLRQLPVDILKIDRSFVQAMTVDERGSRVVETILELGDRLGLQAVAGGIELTEQRSELARLGCRVGQGFYFSHALAPEEIGALLGATEGLPLLELLSRKTGRSAA